MLLCDYANLYKNNKELKKELYESNKNIIEMQKEIDDKNLEVKLLTNQLNNMQETISMNGNYFIDLIEPLKESDKELYLKLYLKLINDYSVSIDAPLKVEEYYDQTQVNMMERTIETETFGADFESKCNVASVILNRVENELFPTVPCEVISSPNQFSYHKRAISETTKNALQYVFMIEDTTNGALAFRSDSKPNKWCGLTYQFTDNAGHNFYK